MAEKRFVKGSEEWVIFQDFYKLCQSIWIIEGNDIYWDHVKDEVDGFLERYEGDVFAKYLAFALLNTLEEKEKNRKGV